MVLAAGMRDGPLALGAPAVGACGEGRGGLLRCYGGATAGGSQGPLVNSMVRASRASMPHLAVVDRYDWTIAKSASPRRVRQVPPEARCWTLTGRMSRSAGLEVKPTARSVANRRIMSSWARNRRAARAASG